MFLFTLVLGVLFLPEADNLKCKCSPSIYGVCFGDTECSSQNDRCLAATQVTVLGDKVYELNYTGCSLPELCLDSSVNFGVFKFVQKRSCCSGDLCNAQTNYTKPDYNLPPNGRKCFSCEGENCMKTLNCVGIENNCIKVTGNAKGESLTLKGCASESFCSNQLTSLVKLLASLIPGLFPDHISCCQGNLCNSASSTSPILLLLLVPLLFSDLFS